MVWIGCCFFNRIALLVNADLQVTVNPLMSCCSKDPDLTLHVEYKFCNIQRYQASLHPHQWNVLSLEAALGADVMQGGSPKITKWNASCTNLGVMSSSCSPKMMGGKNNEIIRSPESPSPFMVQNVADLPNCTNHVKPHKMIHRYNRYKIRYHRSYIYIYVCIYIYISYIIHKMVTPWRAAAGGT